MARLTFACGFYDRTEALRTGDVKVKDIDLDFIAVEQPRDLFDRMGGKQEFDASEFSSSEYISRFARGDRTFVALPVFPSRVFRHGYIYVNRKAGIRSPKDIAGKRVGVPLYTMTAAVWIRGILADAHGVPVDSVTYVTGGLEEPGRPEKLALDLPPNIRVRRIGPAETLSGMLATGEIDALYTARTPSSFHAGDGRVRRLFEDFPAVERAYFRRTRIFPIMHTVVIRRDIYRSHRWIAQSLYKAFAAAQREAYDDLAHTAALKTMLPWLTAHVEDTRREMGADFWPYGVAPNADTLATFLRYSHEQGLSRRRLSPDELFAPETLESFRI